MEKTKLSKRKIKLVKVNRDKFVEQVYNFYILKKVKRSIRAIERGDVYTLEEVMREVETWK